jgi:hypothetical protein
VPQGAVPASLRGARRQGQCPRVEVVVQVFTHDAGQQLTQGRIRGIEADDACRFGAEAALAAPAREPHSFGH